MATPTRRAEGGRDPPGCAQPPVCVCVCLGGDLRESRVALVEKEGAAASGLHTPHSHALCKIPRHRGTDAQPVEEMVHEGSGQHSR